MSTKILQSAQQTGTPLIDGETVTFLWRGPNPPHLIGDFTDWESGAKPIKLKRAAPNLYTTKLDFPRDAYIEYAFVRSGRRVIDPFNTRRVWNGISAYNQFFAMPEAAPTPLAKRSRSVPRGAVTRHVVQGTFLVHSGKREVYLYQPAAPGPHPLVVVYDGPDYLRRAQLTTIVDNLIAQKRIQPMALAMVQNGGLARFMEYAASDSTVMFLKEALLPLARQHLHLLDPEQNPGAYGVLGASMGGLMALYTGLRLPHIFGKVLCQSSGFETWGHEHVIFPLVQYGPWQPLTIWMDVGRYDMTGFVAANRRMLDLLIGKGYRVTYREYNAGHNYPAWRDEVWRGLETLFGS